MILTLKIFFLYLQRLFDLSHRRFLCFFLESIKKHYQFALIKTAKYSIYITLKFNSNLKQSISTLQILEELLRNPICNGYEKKHVVDLIFNLYILGLKEGPEIVFKINKFSLLLHTAKLTNNGTGSKYL